MSNFPNLCKDTRKQNDEGNQGKTELTAFRAGRATAGLRFWNKTID
jgi:hypothetical protein